MAATSWFFKGAGLGIEQETSLYFVDSTIEIEFYRHYSSPCLLDPDRIAQYAVCGSSAAQKAVIPNLVRIAEACDAAWNSDLETLSVYAGRRAQA
jgi:hypothetical protein